MSNGLLNVYGAGIIAFALIFGPAQETKTQRLAAMTAAAIWPVMVGIVLYEGPEEIEQ